MLLLLVAFQLRVCVLGIGLIFLQSRELVDGAHTGESPTVTVTKARMLIPSLKQQNPLYF